MNIDVRSSRLAELVDEGVEVERLAGGFQFTEGPVWNPDGQFLLFSDIPASSRRRWDERSGVREVANPTNKANGMTLDAGRRLVVCEHSTSVVSRMDGEGTGAGREVVASHYEGRELNSPNDVVVRSDGSIYFTDPAAGRTPSHGLERPRQLDFLGVFRVPPEGGEPQLLVRDFAAPNGLCFSPDESVLYINDTRHAHIRAFDVQPDGSLSGDRVFASGIGSFDPARGRTGLVDGMKCDERGDIWVTGPDGIWIIGPDGEHLGSVRVPESVANLHWGGPDWNWMYVTATTSLFRFRTRVSGRREPFMS
ncbi:MAG: SMP-30/gluconolactonase/LRE family protein [Candidatus Dormibacteraeota bacterium]|nr:SMP-30/gluconolactonase/LRE family protein [Candidatus Dormibacteraeota bacterium]